VAVARIVELAARLPMRAKGSRPFDNADVRVSSLADELLKRPDCLARLAEMLSKILSSDEEAGPFLPIAQQSLSALPAAWRVVGDLLATRDPQR
jgi:hypothetical protein